MPVNFDYDPDNTYVFTRPITAAPPPRRWPLRLRLRLRRRRRQAGRHQRTGARA